VKENLNTIVFLGNTFDYRKGSISTKDGVEIFMEPRLKELFYVLLTHPNEFIERDTLLLSVWKDLVVSEQSVTKAISDLRKFLSQNKFKNLKIITISKLGYKLEFHEAPKKLILNRAIKFVAYAVGIILGLFILIRALRYDQ
jgi:DNA-binding winged helix-turn-helix (wHTH) protein